MTQPNTTEISKAPAPETASTSYNSSAAIIAGAALIATTLNAQTTTLSDVDILNYALTLERLEASFYTQGLKGFAPSDFTNSQFSQNLGNPNGLFGDSVTSDVFSYLLLIRDHEQTHVQTLLRTIAAYGGTPKPACTFNITYNTIDDFLAIAKVLEDTGVSAYDGAINLIKDPNLVTTAATIATVEGRHASYIRLITGDTPFPNAFDPARTMAEILAAAAPYLTSCPAS